MNEFDALVEGFEGLDADEKQLLAGQIQANSHLAAPDNEIVSHGMTVGDQSTADAFDEILGAPSSEEGERRPDVAEVAGSIPAGPTPAHREPTEEEAALGITRVSDIAAMTRDAWEEAGHPWPGENVAIVDEDEPPHEPDDWPEPAAEIPLFAELRPLKPDRRPEAGVHFVIFGGKPIAVARSFNQTEDEFVRSQMDPSDTLKDHDGQRRVRADRTLRQRYRGYVSGEMRSL